METSDMQIVFAFPFAQWTH